MQNPFQFAEAFKSSFDLNQLFDTQRRNVEAFSEASKAMVEGVQAIARRQSEIARERTEQFLKAGRELMSGGAPDASLSKQAEYVKDAVEQTLGNIREVTEMATKSSFEAFDVLNKRASQSLEEISRASGSPAPKRKAA